MSTCVCRGTTYKRHSHNEKGVCKHCGKKTENRATEAKRRSSSANAKTVPAQNL